LVARGAYSDEQLRGIDIPQRLSVASYAIDHPSLGPLLLLLVEAFAVLCSAICLYRITYTVCCGRKVGTMGHMEPRSLQLSGPLHPRGFQNESHNEIPEKKKPRSLQL